MNAKQANATWFFRGFVIGVFAAPLYLTLALLATGIIP